MCLKVSQWYPSPPSRSPACRRQQKSSKLRVRRLARRRGLKKAVAVVGTEMELKNLKLYLENKSIIEENKKLRKKALLLHQENRALMLQIQKKFSHIDDFASNVLPNQ